MLAWHEEQITAHLGHLLEVRDRAGEAGERLEAVLEAYALICHESRRHHDTELAAFLHRGEQLGEAQRQVVSLFRDLLDRAVETGGVRDDVSSKELASYCLHALAAAARLPSKAAVRRLVGLTISGLRPPR